MKSPPLFLFGRNSMDAVFKVGKHCRSQLLNFFFFLKKSILNASVEFYLTMTLVLLAPCSV